MKIFKKWVDIGLHTSDIVGCLCGKQQSVLPFNASVFKKVKVMPTISKALLRTKWEFFVSHPGMIPGHKNYPINICSFPTPKQSAGFVACLHCINLIWCCRSQNWPSLQAPGEWWPESSWRLRKGKEAALLWDPDCNGHVVSQRQRLMALLPIVQLLDFLYVLFS